jgi:hypothetical protein
MIVMSGVEGYYRKALRKFKGLIIKKQIYFLILYNVFLALR